MTTTLYIEANGQRFPVDSFADASRKWDSVQRRLMDEGIGSSGSPNVRILDADGTQIAYISWNGRIWSGTEYVRGAVPLYDPFVA